MQVFQEGQQYSLSTNSEKNKSLFFVKLTDSALQSIEMFLNSKGDSSLKPTIQFQDNSGTISFPVNDRKHNYGFTLSNMETDGLQSSFYCFQHTRNRSLKSLGIMLNRMHIHAKEDTYEKTKFKMAAAEKEQKSFCTKEIKLKGTRLRHKLKCPELLLPPGNCYSAGMKPKLANCNKKNVYSAISSQPIRKRIIHILAMKPYKKPELLLRLMREGIINGDKEKLNSVLSSVGILKENVYNLASNLWNEVEENWEFCTKEELQLIQRRKQQFLKQNTEIKPVSKSQKNGSVIQSISTELIDEYKPLNKKRRISHSGPKETDKIVKENSSGSNTCNKNKLPAVSNFKNSPHTKLQVNDHCKNTGLEKKASFVVNCRKGFLYSSKLEEKSEDQLSSKNQTEPNFEVDESKQKNSKNGQQVFVNNNHFNVPQIGTFISFLPESDSHTEVQVKDHSKYKGMDFRKYEYSIPNLSKNIISSHTNTFMVDGPKVISPVSCSNSSDSSLCEKDNKNCVGSVEDASPIVDGIPELDYSDYMQMHSTIVSKKQRSQYAKEFNTWYEEYLKLHARMREISEKFTYLENCLLQCEKGSNEFKKIRAKIQKESETTLQNNNYICAWKKFNFLQSKLSLIKRLIKEYDSSQDRES